MASFAISSKAACMRGVSLNTSRAQAARPRCVAPARKVTTYAGSDLPSQYKSVKPVADRVFVKVDKTEEKTVGGILLPTSAGTKPTKGKVMAVGPGAKKGDETTPVAVRVGDMVSYSQFAGTEVTIDGEAHILLKEEDCIGTMGGDDVSTLKPLSDRVLIKCNKTEEETTGGLLLTGKGEKPLTGDVVAMGPGKGEDSMDMSVGSAVLYSKYSGTEFESSDGDEYIVVRAADVLAVLS